MSSAVLYVSQDVDLQLKLGRAKGEDTLMRPGKVVGPDLAIACIARESRSTSQTVHLSPPTPVTLPPEARLAAGIPLDATQFCFMHPMDCMATRYTELLKEPALLKQSWLDALMLGAFVYLGSSSEVLRINALALAPSTENANKLYLEGPFEASDAAFSLLKKAGRIKQVMLGSLLAAGLRSFAWVNPGERVGGRSLGVARDANWEHGAFVYQSGPDNDTRQIFFRIGLGESADSGPDSFMAQALKVVRDEAEEAAEKERQMEEELADWHRPPVSKWWRQHSARLFIYYTTGCLVYATLEGWHWFDTVYFLTTTATTVGYGDVVPSTNPGRVFTAMFAPLGCVYVAAAMVPIVTVVLDNLGETTKSTAILLSKLIAAARRCHARLLEVWDDFYRWVRCRRPRALGQPKKKKVPKPDWDSVAQYINLAIGPIIVIMITTCVAYFAFNDDLPSSIYFSVVTMTTIGYGDLCPTSWDDKLFLILLMPVATASLARLVEESSTIATRDAIRNAKFQFLIDDLLLNESKGDPGRKLNEADFLRAALKAYNLVDDESIQAITNGFKELLTVPEAQQAQVGGQKGASGDEGVGPEVVFAHMVRQRRIRHRSIDDSSETNVAADGAILVDMSAPDQGFKEWYERSWSVAVRKKAEEQSNYAPVEKPKPVTTPQRLPPPRKPFAAYAKATPRKKNDYVQLEDPTGGRTFNSFGFPMDRSSV
jgi:voltage-gated potassium channel Kch